MSPDLCYPTLHSQFLEYGFNFWSGKIRVQWSGQPCLSYLTADKKFQNIFFLVTHTLLARFTVSIILDDNIFVMITLSSVHMFQSICCLVVHRINSEKRNSSGLHGRTLSSYEIDHLHNTHVTSPDWIFAMKSSPQAFTAYASKPISEIHELLKSTLTVLRLVADRPWIPGLYNFSFH